MIHLPKTKPQRISGFVQPPDLTATIVELAKANKLHPHLSPPLLRECIPRIEERGEFIDGKSILPLIKEKKKIRDFAVSSPSIIHGSAGGQRATIATKDWTFIYGLEEQEERRYETRIVDGKVRVQKRLGKRVEPELYHLSSDPGQKRNVFLKHKDIARKLHSQFIKFLETVKTEENILKPWRVFK